MTKTAPPDAYETIFSALSHRSRRQVLMTLNFNGGTMAAGDIAAMFQHSWPTTTRHLKVLIAAQLITQKKQGRSRLYTLNRDRLLLVSQWLAWFHKDPGGADEPAPPKADKESP